MTVILALMRRSKEVSFPSEPLFDPYLPFDDATRLVCEHGDARLYVWQWGAALDRQVRHTPEYAIAVQGYERPNIEADLVEAFRSGSRLEEKITGACSAVYIDGRGVRCFQSLAGTTPLFYLQTRDWMAVASRLSMLAPLADLTIRNRAVSWMAGRYHLADFDTIFNETKQLEPGAELVMTHWQCECRRPNLGFLFAKLDMPDAIQAVDDAVEHISEVVQGIDRELFLGLSGGKDSRAILAMLKAAGRIDSRLRVSTQGNFFSPEVMAAQDVAKRLELGPEQYRVSPPAYVSRPIDLSAKIATSLYAREGEASLADLTPISRVARLYVGGHENGFKTGYNSLDIDEFLARSKYWVDGFNVLKTEVRDSYCAAYNALLRERLDGVPREYFKHIEMLMFRNPTYLAASMRTSISGASEFHPFLDVTFMKLLLSAPQEMLETQMIHFLVTRKAGQGIENLPFCNDAWPSDLFTLLRKHGVAFDDEAREAVPYRFLDVFPNVSSFGLYNWRQDLAELAKPCIRDMISSHPQVFDVFDRDRVDELLDKPTTKCTYQELYCVLGLLNGALLVHLGPSFLDRRKIPEIAKEVERLLGSSSQQLASYEDQLTAKLSDFDKSLGELARLVRASTMEAEKQALREQLADENLPMQRLDEEGVTLHVQTEGKRHATVSLRISADEGEARNALLMAVKCNGEDKPLEGFVQSYLGFYYRYLSAGNGRPHRCQQQILLPPETSDVTITVRTWANKGPIFVANPPRVHLA